MILYNLLITLEEKKIYTALHHTGVIPASIHTYFRIYKAFLKELETEPRRTQAAFNVSDQNSIAMMTVYRAINYMNREVNVRGEISF